MHVIRVAACSLVLLTGACIRVRVTRTGTAPAVIDARTLEARLTAFAHDSMMGRPIGTQWNTKATDYVASQFQRFGLEPAGDNGTWFQTLPYYSPSDDAASRIEIGAASLVAGRGFVALSPGAAPRPLDGASAIYSGTLGDSSTWVSADQASNRIVVVNAAREEARRLPGLARLLATSPRFARAALIAVVQPGADPPPTPTASVLDTLGNPRLVPYIALTAANASVLLGENIATLKPGAMGPPVRGRVRFAWRASAYPSRNVVGIVRGSDPALRGQYVSITAHNDHIGFTRVPVDHDSLRAFNSVVRPLGADSPPRPATAEQATRVRTILDSLRRLRPPRPDSISNGADDDGSGTIALIALAEAFSKTERPRRSILFVSHTAEESGLLGSQWFTDHPTVPLDSIVAEIDVDMIGRGAARDIKGGGPTYLEVVGLRRLSKEFGDILERANAKEPIPFVFNYEYDAPGHPQQYYCRADHYSYARYGIPSVSLSRGSHMDYHQVTDEPQYIDYPDYARLVQMVFHGARAVANADQRPKLDGPKPADPHVRCRQ